MSNVPCGIGKRADGICYLNLRGIIGLGVRNVNPLAPSPALAAIVPALRRAADPLAAMAQIDDADKFVIGHRSDSVVGSCLTGM